MITYTHFKYQQSRIVLNDDLVKNQITINNIQYYVGKLPYLDNNERNKGGNSYVFALYQAQTFTDTSNPEKVIKISNKFDGFRNNRIIEKDANKRFRREIKALEECKQKKIDNVIEIDYSGHLVCCADNNLKKYFPFYLMDYADSDLKRYLEENSDIDKKSRLDICLIISKGLNELKELGYYHRDLKPDNILLFGDDWKIGDLGLIKFRGEDNDKKNELIGPKGWLSPEAMNKYLAEGRGNDFDCDIDHQSDIFQLGKIFWYIIQGNAPIGCIGRKDFIYNNDDIYNLIKAMICHSKKDRIRDISDVIRKLEEIVEK